MEGGGRIFVQGPRVPAVRHCLVVSQTYKAGLRHVRTARPNTAAGLRGRRFREEN